VYGKSYQIGFQGIQKIIVSTAPPQGIEQKVHPPENKMMPVFYTVIGGITHSSQKVPYLFIYLHIPKTVPLL